MIAEKLLGEDSAAAAIAIDAAQIKGVLPLPLSALRSTLPVFKNPANRHRAVSLTAEQFRYASATRVTRGGVRRAVRAVDDPGARQAAVRGGGGELLPALAGQGRHRQRRPRAAAAHHGRSGPHRARRRSPSRRSSSTGTPTAVTELIEFAGPRPLAHHRQRLARGRRRLPGLAREAGPASSRLRRRSHRCESFRSKGMAIGTASTLATAVPSLPAAMEGSASRCPRAWPPPGAALWFPIPSFATRTKRFSRRILSSASRSALGSARS